MYLYKLEIPKMYLINFNFAENTTARVSADLRSLYSVSSIDDYELLKKQVTESMMIASALESTLRPAKLATGGQVGGVFRVIL